MASFIASRNELNILSEIAALCVMAAEELGQPNEHLRIAYQLAQEMAENTDARQQADESGVAE